MGLIHKSEIHKYLNLNLTNSEISIVNYLYDIDDTIRQEVDTVDKGNGLYFSL